MIKTILFLLLSTILFAQNSNVTVDKNSKSNQFIQRHINQNLNILSNNPKFADSSKAEIVSYFSTTKTAKFISFKYASTWPPLRMNT